jgi:intracellular sulfur oxidation DsrE/DsrF family protein
MTEMTEPTLRGLVVHVPDTGSSAPVLRNVTNLLAELGAGIAVEVVAHGPGIDLVLAGRHDVEVTDLISTGVLFSACRNTIRSRNLHAEALVPGVQVVASGVARVAQLQWAGYAYLRP